ncbi:Alpha/Beta hydrolase protein [Armillaria nabsnona]|nr:Alpha/Beta hydrolase protein [Armillaria nabsnona]
MEQVTQVQGREISDILVPNSHLLIWHNLGSFFATRGFITVIPDYCLINSGFQFPGAAQDVRNAIQWVVDNPSFPDSDIYILGHSAGAMNMFTILALLELYSPTLHPRIKGAILLSGCYTFEDMPVDMKESVRLYYGEDAEVKRRVPLALLDLASVPTPQLLLSIGERDIPCLHPTMEKFDEALKAKGVSYDKFVTKGHNYISLVFVLGTGQGEEWADDVVKWIHAPRG